MPRFTTEESSDVRLPTKKSQALLIYLASPPGVVRSRDQLAGLLWSRSADEQARTSLRQNLARLRKSLGSAKDIISADSQQIKLIPELFEPDTALLEGLISKSDIESLEAAADLLKGEFAAGFNVNEGPFEEWIETERRRILDMAVSALERLLKDYEKQEDFGKAVVICRKVLSIDPLQEQIHQSLMRALAHPDRFESVLQQFKSCQDLLRK